jgi:hypothetical protein
VAPNGHADPVERCPVSGAEQKTSAGSAFRLLTVQRSYPTISQAVTSGLLCEDHTTKADLNGAQDAIIDLMRDNGSAETSHSAILGD